MFLQTSCFVLLPQQNKKDWGCIRTRKGFSGSDAASFIWELNLRLEIPRQNLHLEKRLRTTRYSPPNPIEAAEKVR